MDLSEPKEADVRQQQSNEPTHRHLRFLLQKPPSLVASLLLSASARQINVFVHVFHPLAGGQKEQFAVMMLFADWGGHSPAWV